MPRQNNETDKVAKHFWFGDSWVVGNELELLVPAADVPLFAFPALVSANFSAEAVNLGENGSSIDILVDKFRKALPLIDPQCDTVFFCLTSKVRRAMFDENGNHVRITPGSAEPTPGQLHHPQYDKWYKYFDNEYIQNYFFKNTISLLYLMCEHYNINCYFFNLFTPVTNLILETVPESAWLIPMENCLAEQILYTVEEWRIDDNRIHTKDKKVGYPILDDNPFILTEVWEKQQEYKQKFFSPCFLHPNIDGHKAIADYLTNELKKQNAKTK